MKLTLLFLLAAASWAQSGIEVPALGAVVDPSGELRPVQGVAGNLLLGPAMASSVVSAACAERMCLAKIDSGTDSRIVSASGETGAPPGPAIFGLDGDQAIVFFPNAHSFARWSGNMLESLAWSVDGEVLSIRVRDGQSEIAVRRDERVWIVDTDGSVVDSIAEARGPVLLLPEGVLYATASEVVLRRMDGSEARFDLAGADSIAAMGPRYAAIHASSEAGQTLYALRIESGRESLFVVPGKTP